MGKLLQTIPGPHGGNCEPPADDRVNGSLRHLSAERLNRPISAARIGCGSEERSKRVKIQQVTRTQVLALLTEG